jgi:uncharacterized protein YjbI with pentapeptide repeats
MSIAPKCREFGFYRHESLQGSFPAATLQRARARGGAVVDARKINPFDVGALEKSLNDSATRVSTIWVSFLLFGLYLVTAAGTVTHRQLFLKDPIKLPVLNIELPFLGFWLLAPTLFVIFHAYVLIQVLLLARTAAAYNEAVDRTVGNDTYQSHIRQRLANTLFAQIFAGSPRERLGLLGLVLRLMAWTTLAIAPFFILLTFELKFLPYHSQLVTWVHRLLIAADLFALFLLWPAALDARRNIGSWSVWQYLISITVVVAWACLCVLMISFPGERHARWLTQDGHAGAIYSGIQLREIGKCRDSKVAWLFFDNFDRLYLPRESFVEDDKLSKFDIANRHRALKPHEGERSRNLRYRNLNCGTFKGADLRRADFEGATLIGANLKEAGLHGALLAGARLHGASLDKAQLQDASLEGADLQGASLNEAQLQGAFLDGAKLQNASLYQALLQEASLNDANLSGAWLYLAQLQGASLTVADLRGATLDGAQLQGASLGNSFLEGASLAGAQLQGALLADSNLQGASFFDAALQGASLIGAHLEGASLDVAQLQGASLDRASLVGADLQNARLDGASLDAALLQGAVLARSGMTGAYVHKAFVWRAKGAACLEAYVSDHKPDAVLSHDLGKPIEASTKNIEKFIEDHASKIPATPVSATYLAPFNPRKASVREQARDRMRRNLLPPSKDDAEEIAQTWKACEASPKKKSRHEFNSERAAYLRNLACNAPDNRKAIVTGIVWNSISIRPDQLDLSIQLALSLLGKDGKECAATKDLDERTTKYLHQVIAMAPESAQPPPPAR